jgi:hypothetical protein
MNEICERALECYIKKLEKDNETLRDFAKGVNSTVYDFDGANPDKSDKERIADIRCLIKMYKPVLDEK